MTFPPTKTLSKSRVFSTKFLRDQLAVGAVKLLQIAPISEAPGLTLIIEQVELADLVLLAGVGSDVVLVF